MAMVAATALTFATETGAQSAVAPAAAMSRLPGLADNTYGYNAAPFVQDNLVTIGNRQYATWWNSARRPIIAKRILPTGAWSTYDLSKVSGNPLASPVARDGHNSIALGVDSDGRIHVAGNMHSNVMRYVRSVNPHSISSWTTTSRPGRGSTQITYPQFVRLSTGALYLSYRDGTSGNGDDWLEKWNPTTRRWFVRKIVDGRTSGESPYLHRIAVGPDDSIHYAIVWRGTGVATTNGDLTHIVSRDGGSVWRSMGGTKLARPITHATAPKVLDTAASWSGILNQSGMDVDPSGRPHIVTHIWNADQSASRILHSTWDGSRWVNAYVFDNWTYRMPTMVSVVNGEIARPSVFCTASGRVFTIYRNNVDAAQSLRIREITPGGGNLDAAIYAGNLYAYEPSFDGQALRDRNELRMIVTRVRSTDRTIPEYDDRAWTQEPIGVLTMNLSQIDAVLAGTAAVPGTI